MSGKYRKFLITGGAGFVGYHAITRLLKQKKRVTVLDNFMTSSPSALKEFGADIRLIRGDIRNEATARRAMKGQDVVLHLAAIRSVMKSVEDPGLAHEVNATGTLILLQEAARAGVQRFLFASTSAVYGEACSGSQRENGGLKPVSPYGVAKLAAEQYAHYYFKQKNLKTTCFRIFNVYGPHQNPESRYSLVVPGVLSRIYKNRPPVIDGSGRQSRDFVFIDDVLDAFWLSLYEKKAHGEVFNLGSGRAHSIRYLVAQLLSLCGSNLKPLYGPRRAGDPDMTCADIRKAQRLIGWKPRTTLREGLRQTVMSYGKEK